MDDPGFTQTFTVPRARIDGHLASVVGGLETPEPLRAAMRYALLEGGKRLRPLLAWHCCVATAGDPGVGPLSLPAGAAVELVHAFSLVHDDLPAMDDDDMRRGRPTLHVHAGEAMAILAGDAMLALAFGVLSAPAESRPAYEPGLRCRLIEELSRGTSGMIAGQVLDTIGADEIGQDDAARVERIHALKTGALISAACRMGAIVGSCGRGTAEADRRLDAIDGYASAIGLMFQIVDDLLDVEQSAEHTGKRTGKDSEAGKLTYPAVHGVAASRAMIGELLDLAQSEAGGLGDSASMLQELAAFLAQRST